MVALVCIPCPKEGVGYYNLFVDIGYFSYHSKLVLGQKRKRSYKRKRGGNEIEPHIGFVEL